MSDPLPDSLEARLDALPAGMDQIVLGIFCVVGFVVFMLVLGGMNPQQRDAGGPGPHVHQWQKYDVYFSTLRGYEHAIIKDRCTRDGCRMVKTVVGGPLLLWPQVTIEEGAVSEEQEVDRQ